MILSAVLLVGWCVSENVYAAISPVEEPENFLQLLGEDTNTLPHPPSLISQPEYLTSNFLSTFDALKTETMDKNKILRSSIRHLKHLKTKVGPDVSLYINSASENGSNDEMNSIESQRKAFLDILNKNTRKPKLHKKHHKSSKIKLRYDYINRKYYITEDSEES